MAVFLLRKDSDRELADVCLWPCAPKARIISGGRFPPRELSIDPIADERLGWVTGRAGAS